MTYRGQLVSETVARRKRMFHGKAQLVDSFLSTSGLAVGAMWNGMLNTDAVLLKTDEIKQAVCEAMAISLNDLLSYRRLRRNVNARFIAFYFMRKYTHLSYPQIGRLMGHRNHSTVMNGLEYIEAHPERFAPWLASVAARLGVLVF